MIWHMHRSRPRDAENRNFYLGLHSLQSTTSWHNPFAPATPNPNSLTRPQGLSQTSPTCLVQPCLQQFHYIIPFLSGDAFKLAKSLPSNLNFCFPLLSFMDAVPLIVTIFVLLPVSPSLLSVFPLLTIPLENLMPPHPGPWSVHSHLSTLSTLHPHLMLSKQPKSHQLLSERVEPVSLVRLQIPGRQDTCQCSFSFSYWAWEEQNRGNAGDWKKGKCKSSLWKLKWSFI